MLGASEPGLRWSGGNWGQASELRSACIVEEYLARFPNCREFPLSLGVIQTAAEITDIPELHDRLIGATARIRNVEPITNDLVIQVSAFVRTIW